MGIGGSQKTNIKGDFLKKGGGGGLDSFANLRGKRGRGVFEGGGGWLIPQCTL